ncbi:DNA alkylation repair protein [archaeon]|nr:DNA alkylation repair protein [archaeon]
MDYDEIIKKLKSLQDPKNVEGMARFGINPEKTLGVSVPNIRKIAKQAGKDHALAEKLWSSGIHEARILASMVDEPEKVTKKQVNAWTGEFDSWDVCDQCCMNLFDKLPFAFEKAIEFTKREREFEKRAGFALMACLAVHDKVAGDEKFTAFFPRMKLQATDERNYVKKAVNWSLRQVGKRNLNLNKAAIKIALEIQKIESKSAKWIANDAIRELESEAVKKRLNIKKH